MTRLLITRGLPASGKTTFARKLQPYVVRVNRDDLRRMLHGRRLFTQRAEAQVTHAQRAAVEALLRAHTDVIVDDTNLRAKTVREWAELAARWACVTCASARCVNSRRPCSIRRRSSRLTRTTPGCSFRAKVVLPDAGSPRVINSRVMMPFRPGGNAPRVDHVIDSGPGKQPRFPAREHHMADWSIGQYRFRFTPEPTALAGRRGADSDPATRSSRGTEKT